MPAQDSAAFISYSREDSEFALRLAQDLKAAGAHVWLDQLDIAYGHPWDNAIEQALGEAVQMLIILSPSSAKSENVRNEISYALGQGKIIIPVLYKDCVVPLQLQRTQRIDFRADYARGLNHLLEHLHVTEPDASVLKKAAEGDAQRQAAWVAREREAQRMKQIAGDGVEGSGVGAEKRKKSYLIAGAGLVGIAIAAIVALAVYWMRPKPTPGPVPGPAPAPVSTPSSGSDPIVGCYQWFNGAPVVINSNHTIVGGPFKGGWQANGAQRGYTFTWPEPSVGTVAVTANGQALTGGNQYGIAISGTRISGTSGLVGSWSVVSAVPMTFAVNANGTYSAAMATGTFGGTWKPKYGMPGVYTMTASDLPTDHVTLSANGSSIAGADQYGVPTSGTRTSAPCNLN